MEPVLTQVLILTRPPSLCAKTILCPFSRSYTSTSFVKNGYFTDVFLIPSEIDISNNNVRDILKKAVLLREAKGITSNKNSKKITFKLKNKEYYL